MELKRVLICVALMALVTYIPRVLPVTVFRKQIRSRFIRSFLDYTPYAVLGALTFPDVFFSTGHLFSAAGGTAVAIVLGIVAVFELPQGMFAWIAGKLRQIPACCRRNGR